VEVSQAFHNITIFSGYATSQITDAQIEELAKEAKSGWWEKNKERFLGKEGFEGL